HRRQKAGTACKGGVERRREKKAWAWLTFTPRFHLSFPRLFSTPPFHAVLDYVTSERPCMGSVVRTVLFCAGVAAVAPAAAQSNEERVANDVYTRTHDYDLVHQRIEVRSFDWDS